MSENPWVLFHDAGWDILWYAHPGDTFELGLRWHAGVESGPDGDLICLKKCETKEDADLWLSPAGDTPEEAVKLGVEKRTKLAAGRQVCHRCGNVGAWPTASVHEWCPVCIQELKDKGF